MAAPTNTVTTNTLVGQAEDVEDMIYRVSAEQTPWISNIGTASADARLHEWQLEEIDAINATNAQLEGDDTPANEAFNNTTRVGNYEQIFRKVFGISRTSDLVRKYGRERETNRQKILKGIAMQRDCEFHFIGNFASNNETAGVTPRRGAGACAWITTNASRGAGGADGGFSAGVVAAAVNGTQRAFTETLLREVMAMLFFSRGGSAGDGYQVYMGGTQKQTASQFTGIASIQTQTPQRGLASIIGAADQYQSDYGRLSFIPHPYGLGDTPVDVGGVQRNVLIADPRYWAMAPLDGFKTWNLAKSGDSDRYLQTKETTLVSRNEKSSAVIADLL